MKTLVLCQTAAIQNTLVRTLEQRGHDIDICGDIPSTWHKYQQDNYVLVFMQLSAREEQYSQLCLAIRASSQGYNSVLVAIAQNETSKQLQNILDRGFDDYLIYPFSVEQLNLRLTVIEKQLRYHFPVQKLVSSLLPQKQIELNNFAHFPELNQQHYIVIDRNLSILKASQNVHFFAENSQDIDRLLKGEDIRAYFPELIGIEPQLNAVLEGEREDWHLPGIARSISNNKLLYFDLSVRRYGEDNPQQNDSIFQIIILLNNATEKMIIQQKLTQKVNESQLLIQEITHQQNYINKIIASMADALIVTDRDGRIKIINRAALDLFGYQESEIINLSISSLVAPSDADIFTDFLATSSLMENKIIKCSAKNGNVLTIAFSKAEISTEENQFLDIYIGRDITAQQQYMAEIQELNLSLQAQTEELAEANQELEAFSHTVSHDLRNPLNHVNLCNYLLEEEYADILDEQGKYYLNQIKQSCDRMGQLIRDLLQLSMLKHQEIEAARIDLSNLVQEILRDFQLQYPQRQVNCTVAPNLVTVGDSKLLRIALENLIGNSWKYTSKKEVAEIEIGAIAPEERQSVEADFVYFIRDNGAGFDMQYADRLFKAFNRLHSQSEFEGTGIGLTTVQRIIQRHGGEIWAKGQIDCGATFYFTLPDEVTILTD